jgi:transcriptional regulator with XRE-family HTH domain
VITTEQIKAARMLLGWDQIRLSVEADVPVSTLKRVEARSGPVQGNAKTVWKLQEALEMAGIEFINVDETGGAGVRFKHRQ